MMSQRVSQHVAPVFTNNADAVEKSAYALHHTEKHPDDLPDFSVSRVKKCAGYVHRKCMEAIVVQQSDPAMNRRIAGSGSVSLFF